MCGRFSLAVSPDELVAHFRLAAPPAWRPRYNIAPTQDVLIVRGDPGGPREASVARWGLIPLGAPDAAVGARMINARCETAARKPSFRWAFEHNRCLVPADGFYEWSGRGPGGRKQPYHIHLARGGLLAFAGLWDRWLGPSGEEIPSCTILTTEANELVRPIHDRMPVILSPDAYDVWLNPAAPMDRLEALWAPLPGSRMAAHPVDPVVNSVAHDGPECVAPPPPPEELDLFD